MAPQGLGLGLHVSRRVSSLLSVQICNFCPSYSYHMLFCALYCLVHSTTSTEQIKNLHTQGPYSLSSSSDLEDKWYKLPAFKEKECFAVQSSAIVRNGINFPPEKLITEISSVHKKLVEAMDLDVYVKLYEWNNPFSNDKAEFLSKRGKIEQLTLGKQFAHKLLSLYSNEDIGDLTFLSSSQAAPRQSSQSFYSGFFDGLHGEEFDEHDVSDFDTDVDDKLLRHFNRCPSSRKHESNKESAEFYKFLSGDYVESVRRKISQKLGLQKDVLTNENVWQMYLICGYEQANLESSPWCSLFEEDDMDILEYLGDLRLHHDVGYGTNQTWPHGCLLLTEIFTAMEEAIDEIEGLDINEEVDGYTVGLFAFAETETVATFMSVLGLFNDTPPLQADNFESQRQRNFHGGRIIPFSTNVMLILYECAPEDYKTAETTYFVKLFVNEKATLIPGCSSFYCPFQQITKHFEFLTEDCHSKKFCGGKTQRDEL